MLKTFMLRSVALFTLFYFSAPYLEAQVKIPDDYSSSAILQGLEKARTLGSVLYVAAHPDDENQRLISFYSKEKHLKVGYLSITRGDGGQNLIGTEIGPLLGVLRTQELLEARKRDGGQQFFTRGYDFGYSKSSEETMRIWDREKVLGDMVWVIRNFRPDVIITRFPDDGTGGHGHHTASSTLAQEAFKLAADKSAYPEQLKYTKTWQPKRILWNAWVPRLAADTDMSEFLNVDIGTYNPVLGKSYNEISAESRSMHKSQGFGASKQRGHQLEHLKPYAGPKVKESVLEDLNLRWNQYKGGDEVNELLQKAIADYNPRQPQQIIHLLIEARTKIGKIDSRWKQEKMDELDQLIMQCSGLWMEAFALQPAYTSGDKIQLNIEGVTRSEQTVLSLVKIPFAKYDTTLNMQMEADELISIDKRLIIDKNTPISQPYWLRNEMSQGLFTINDQQLIGKPENDPALSVIAKVSVQTHEFEVLLPVKYKSTDPVRGEEYQPVAVTPPVMVNFNDQVLIIAKEKEKQVNLVLRAGKDEVSGKVSLNLPKGWKSIPENHDYLLKFKNDEQSFTFMVSPQTRTERITVTPKVTYNGQIYDRAVANISYPHIEDQLVFPKAELTLAKIQVANTAKEVAYIMGAGDEVPKALEQMGSTVTMLDVNTIESTDLSRFDAIVTGVRAYNVIDRLKYAQPTLLKYVENGGTLIMQYNTAHRLVTTELGPYPITIGRDRITDENAEMTLLQPQHPIFNSPNKIDKSDMENWIQERGLYFATDWDEKYTPLISGNDAGEKATEGALLVAAHGEGHFIFTGLSFFRELPAGVTGAYRLMANLISYGNSTSNTQKP